MSPNLACVLLLVYLFASGGSTPEASAEGNAPETSVEGSKLQDQAKGSIPEVNVEKYIPEVIAEENSPEVSVEESTCELKVEERTPDVNAKGSRHEVSIERTPEENALNKYKVNTEESTPEVSVEGSGCEGSSECTPEENSGKTISDANTKERNPEVTVEGNTLEVNVDESISEVSTENSTPEVNVKESPPEVSIVEGKLQGTTLLTHKGKIIYAFLGIPYASAPTNQLRFKPPQPVKAWDGVRNAKKEGQHCPQLTYPERNYEGSEDCLYLNVYTTRMPNISNLETALQNVVVLFHDGGFSHGSGDIAMYGPDYLLDHDVVMVTCNYRLGALGFLATGDEFASGNYGLKDQVDVLRWVRRNIHNFSGNPNSVTLFGAGAGAASVHYHMLSGLSRKLFHQAISQSGTALSPWAHVRATTARERAFKLGDLLGCKKKQLENTEQLIKCICKKPAKELVEASTKILDYMTRFTYPFVPVEDEVVPKQMKPLLHDRPINIMKKPLLPALWEIPWLTGITSHEGLPQSLQVMLYHDLKEGLDREPAKTVLKFLGLDVQPEKAQQVGQKIWNFYLQNDSLSYGTNLVKLAEMTSDFNYYYGLQKSVNTLTAASDTPIFVYHFSYHRRDPRFSLGVPHGEDTLYMFPNIIAGTKLVIDKEHSHITECLLRIVTNFAQNGDPTPQESPGLNNIMWPVIEPDKFQYVDINDKLTIKKHFFPDRMTFWDSIYEMIAETPNLVKDEL